jgi:hypothetical protein
VQSFATASSSYIYSTVSTAVRVEASAAIAGKCPLAELGAFCAESLLLLPREKKYERVLLLLLLLLLLLPPDVSVVG